MSDISNYKKREVGVSKDENVVKDISDKNIADTISKDTSSKVSLKHQGSISSNDQEHKEGKTTRPNVILRKTEDNYVCGQLLTRISLGKNLTDKERGYFNDNCN